MDLRNMTTFLKVAELSSFSNAAEELGYSQSAVSTQIIKLEQELNCSLFDRIGHNIFLTESGKKFREYVENVFILTENLENNLSRDSEISGLIRIATSDSLCSSLFTDVFIDFQKTYPNVKFHVRSAITDLMIKSLSTNDVDLVYTLDKKIHKHELTVLRESPESVNFYASSYHPLSKRDIISIDDIQDYPLYLTESGVSYRQELDQALANLDFELIPSVESENVQVIRKLILNTTGIGFLPHFVVKDDIENGDIIPLKIKDIDVTVWKQLIHHKGKSLTPAMEKFISYLKK